MHIKTARSHSAGSPAEVNWFSVTRPLHKGSFFVYTTYMIKTQTRDFSYDQKETIKSFFTNDEWNAIDSAMQDFQDYGESESELTDSVGRKIYELFKGDIRRGQ